MNKTKDIDWGKLGFSYLKTDLGIGDMLYLGTQALSFDMSKMKTHTIPGEPGMKFSASYYFHDAEKTLAMMQEIYARTPESEKLPGEGTPVTEDTNSSNTSN